MAAAVSPAARQITTRLRAGLLARGIRLFAGHAPGNRSDLAIASPRLAVWFLEGLKVDYWLAVPLGTLGVVIAVSLARWAAPENARRMIQVTVTGYGQDALVAFERTVPAAALPRVLAVSGAPDLEHLGALAWPISEADAAAIVGPVPPGLAYRLEGFTSG